MTKHKQPAGLAPGIYFNMPEDTYHNDPAFSHSGMVDVLESWYDYWMHSPLNPARSFKSTDAMTFGTRCHELLLDPKSFFEKYSVTGMGWSSGKKLINRVEFERIKNSIDEIKRVPDAFAYFTKGYPEVSIIVADPETGIRLRIRLDYLRLFGGIDYKRVKSLQNNQLGWFIVDHGHDIQQALYQFVMRLAKEQLRSGKIKAQGSHDPIWVKKFAEEEACLFRFLYQRSLDPYIFKFKRFNDVILNNAYAHVRDAISIYKYNIELFGAARPLGGTAETDEMTEYHLPRRIIDRGDHHHE